MGVRAAMQMHSYLSDSDTFDYCQWPSSDGIGDFTL